MINIAGHDLVEADTRDPYVRPQMTTYHVTAIDPERALRFV